MADLNAPRSTDLMLADGLAAVEDWEAAERGSDAEYQAAEQATRCLAELDAAMRDGGPLPGAWRLSHGAIRAMLAEAVERYSCDDPECTDPSHRITPAPG